MSADKERNRKLIERYPFLFPRNRWTDKVPEDFDYSFTELDAMPDGWRTAFGEKLCEEIREELVRTNCLNEYRITQIKEKYGSLCWYDRGRTERMNREIMPKYVRMSENTCIRCGESATKISTGWICPFCDACATVLSKYMCFVSIEEWYEE